MVERGGLENRCARKRTEGSNPSLSAIPNFDPQKPPNSLNGKEYSGFEKPFSRRSRGRGSKASLVTG